MDAIDPIRRAGSVCGYDLETHAARDYHITAGEGRRRSFLELRGDDRAINRQCPETVDVPRDDVRYRASPQPAGWDAWAHPNANGNGVIVGIVNIDKRPVVTGHDGTWMAGRTGEGPAFRRSIHPDRSPDLSFQMEKYHVGSSGAGTSHGSPYRYDTHVPVIFWLPGVAPARISQRVATVDIAPTVASLLGISTPPDLDGRDLSAFFEPVK